MKNFLNSFALHVQGGTSKDIMAICDLLIDEGTISQEYFDKNEIAICKEIDEHFFNCEGCSWTMPIEEQDGRGDWHCKQCMDEENE